MSGGVRRRLPITEPGSGDANKRSAEADDSKRKKLKSFLKSKVSRIQWRNSWTSVTISSLIVVIMFSLGILVGSFFMWQPRNTCGLKIPKAKRPKLTIWNRENTVGSLVRHYCSNLTRKAINRLYVCNWDFYWMLILHLPCECPNDPIHLPKTSAVIEWNGKYKYNNTAKITCNSNKQSKIAMRLMCTENRVWEITNKTSCDCPEFTISQFMIEHKSISLSKHQIGSSVIEKCSWLENSPSHRSFFCDVNSKWTMLEEYNKCECYLDPPVDPHRPVQWSNSSPSNLIGSKVVSLCAEEPSSTVYQAYQCDADRKWKPLISPEESYCDSQIKILQPNTFSLSDTLCKLYNGHLSTPSTWEERYELAITLRQLRLQCSENWFYIGIVEDLNYQWRSSSRPTNYANLDLLWDVDNPGKVTDKCTVMTKAGKLQNVNCESYTSCILCEKDSTNSEISIVSEALTVHQAHLNCTKQKMKLLSIQSEFDVINLFTRIRRERLICLDYFTDLKHETRVWNYVTGDTVTTPHWSKREPPSFDKNCVAISKSGNFMQWETISCKTIGCGVCEQFRT